MSADDQIKTCLIAEIRRRKEDIAEKWHRIQFSDEILSNYPNAFAEKAEKDAVINKHILPMLDVLAEYASTGNKVYKYLYLALKRHCAPHRNGYVTLNNYYSDVVPNEIRALIEELPGAIKRSAKFWLEDLHKDLIKDETARPLTVAFVGDCLIGETISTLSGVCDESGLSLDPRYYYFSASKGLELDTANVAELLSTTQVDLVALSFLSYDGIPFYRTLLNQSKSLSEADIDSKVAMIVDVIRNYIFQLAELTDATILLHNASGLPLGRIRGRLPLVSPIRSRHQLVIDKLNRAIETLVDEYSNLMLVDETAITKEYGIRNCHKSVLPAKIRKYAHFHPTRFGIYLANQYFEKISTYSLLKGIKLLLIDFDNTLWKGIMAEGAVEQDIEFQKLLSRLRDHGIVLAAVSKNDPENIRWDEMYLKESDFVSLRISWAPKASSVLEIAGELNLGADSFLLIDDSPAERELVETIVPGVRSLDPERADRDQILNMLFAMPNTRDTEEAKTRSGTYKALSQRNQALKQKTDYRSAMASLGLKLAFGRPEKKDLSRVCELIERTNQFNTTTKRYTRQEVMDIVNGDDGDIYIGKLEDKFGKLGIVAVVVVKRHGETAIIDNFVMSCRAMGFGLENLMLSLVIDEEQNCPQIHARFVPSERNNPAAGLYRCSGFEDAKNGLWTLPEKSELDGVPDWFDIGRV